MKNNITSAVAIIVLSFTAFFASCSGGEETTDNPQPTSRSAVYTVNGKKVTVEKPYDGIFNDNGEINNTVSLAAKDSSSIKFIFVGSSAATHQLKAYPDAVYTSPSGQKYNAVRGELIITKYQVSDGIYTFSGTFNFVAKNITNASDSVVITEGVITNCSNKF